MAEPARGTGEVDAPMGKGSAWREEDGGGEDYVDAASYDSSEEELDEENMVMPMLRACLPLFFKSHRSLAGAMDAMTITSL